jgi:plastocyanin
VVWAHKGQRKHTVTADDGAFNSGTLEAGGSFKQTFDKPGTYAYFCEFHGGAGGGGMAGVIKVGDGGAPAAAAPTSAPPAPPTATPPPANVPAALEITIKAGATITWSNDGAKPHSATASDGSFDTAIFQPGQSKSITFSKPGKFAYYCQLHGTPDGNGMVGTVIVE